jgi:hypothetical protein
VLLLEVGNSTKIVYNLKKNYNLLGYFKVVSFNGGNTHLTNKTKIGNKNNIMLSNISAISWKFL